MKQITLSLSVSFLLLAGSSFGQERKPQATESVASKEKSERLESTNQAKSLDQNQKVTVSVNNEKVIKERPDLRATKEKKGTN